MNIIGSAESDPFFAAKRPKSLLCLPLISQKKLQAVLYLHSNTVDAFQDDEREVLKILSVQAATSLEKLSIYRELDITNNALVSMNTQVEEQSRSLAEEVRARTAELNAKVEELKLAKEILQKAKDQAEQNKLEAERSKDHAIQANELKSTFLATMSHEIRTPFNAVNYFSVFLLCRFWEQRLFCSIRISPLYKQIVLHSDFDFVDFPDVETIQTASTDLLRIINDILDFSKVVYH
jgi:signal transduction histidine kinase